jgi:hypothetical protein
MIDAIVYTRYYHLSDKTGFTAEVPLPVWIFHHAANVNKKEDVAPLCPEASSWTVYMYVQASICKACVSPLVLLHASLADDPVSVVCLSSILTFLTFQQSPSLSFFLLYTPMNIHFLPFLPISRNSVWARAFTVQTCGLPQQHLLIFTEPALHNSGTVFYSLFFIFFYPPLTHWHTCYFFFFPFCYCPLKLYAYHLNLHMYLFAVLSRHRQWDGSNVYLPVPYCNVCDVKWGN